MLRASRKCAVMWLSYRVLSINFIRPLVGSYHQNSRKKNEVGTPYCCLFILFYDEVSRTGTSTLHSV